MSSASTMADDPITQFLHKLVTATPRVWVTPTLMAINALLFVVMVVRGVDIFGGRSDQYLALGANFAPLTTSGEWWRLLTCTFLHHGILHVAINMWVLWDTGRITERLFGNVWFAALYLFSGVAGSCASMLWNQQTISVGASGAVFGVFGALLAYITVQRRSIPDQVMSSLKFSTGIFITYSLLLGFAHSSIDNAAHLGGLAAGYIMGLVMARPLDKSNRHNGDIVRAVLAALLAVVAVPTAAGLTPDTSRVYRQAVNLQQAVDAFHAEETRLVYRLQALVDLARSKKINDSAALAELRSNMLPAWDKAIAILEAVELDAKAPTRLDYELLLGYATTRREMTRAIADYLETNNLANEKRVSQLQVETAEALKKYQERLAK